MSNVAFQPRRYKGTDEIGRCHAVHHIRGTFNGEARCSRKASRPTDEGGEIEWCAAHDPAKSRAKYEAKLASWKAEGDARQATDAAALLAAQACDALLAADPETALDKAVERRTLLHNQTRPR